MTHINSGNFHGLLTCWRRTNSIVQLAVCQENIRAIYFAHRGHRSRPQHAAERGAEQDGGAAPLRAGAATVAESGRAPHAHGANTGQPLMFSLIYLSLVTMLYFYFYPQGVLLMLFIV